MHAALAHPPSSAPLIDITRDGRHFSHCHPYPRPSVTPALLVLILSFPMLLLFFAFVVLVCIYAI